MSVIWKGYAYSFVPFPQDCFGNPGSLLGPFDELQIQPLLSKDCKGTVSHSYHGCKVADIPEYGRPREMKVAVNQFAMP